MVCAPSTAPPGRCSRTLTAFPNADGGTIWLKRCYNDPVKLCKHRAAAQGAAGGYTGSLDLDQRNLAGIRCCGLLDLDPHLGRVDLRRALEEAGHGDRKGDHHRDHDRLETDPG